MKPTLTIFTPTYNRAYCLYKGYEALQRQTCKDFLWLVIDDGSTDNTRELVATWQRQENGFEIRYIYKKNGGMYTGYNAAIAASDTELCVCVDSDDWLTDNAVELVLTHWKKFGGPQYAGVVTPDCFQDGRMVGDPLPDQESVNLIDLFVGKYKICNGDRKNFVRTDLYKLVAPMPEFADERDFNPHYLHLEISRKYNFLVLNQPTCIVDYLPDGMHASIFRQYLRSPKGFRLYRIQAMSFRQVPFKYIARNTIHYISSCLVSGEPCLSTSPRKLLTVLLFPAGVLWTLILYFHRWSKNRRAAQ